MTIQISIDNGSSVITRIHRNIKKYELAEWRERFYANAAGAKSGKLSQFKGKERILLASF